MIYDIMETPFFLPCQEKTYINTLFWFLQSRGDNPYIFLNAREK